MKKRNTLIAVILAAGLVAAVPFVYAAPHGPRGMGAHMGMGPGGHGGMGGGMALFGRLGRLQDELDLSDAQVEQIKAIFAETHTQNEAYREQLRGGFHDAALTLLANPNDLAAAQALLDRQAAAQKAMKTNMLTATSKALNVLTAEQRSELAKLIQERSARRAQRGKR